jgi:hypothetical protein
MGFCRSGITRKGIYHVQVQVQALENTSGRAYRFRHYAAADLAEHDTVVWLSSLRSARAVSCDGVA